VNECRPLAPGGEIKLVIASPDLTKVGRCRLTLSNPRKLPGTKRLKLKYDELLPNFAFNFKLRRYTKWGEPRTILPLEEGEAGSGPAPKVLSGRMIVASSGTARQNWLKMSSPHWPTVVS
jgi:hypothetical protein